MIACAECRTEHFGGALFCQACGAALIPATLAHMTARQHKAGQTGAGSRRGRSSCSKSWVVTACRAPGPRARHQPAGSAIKKH